MFLVTVTQTISWNIVTEMLCAIHSVPFSELRGVKLTFEQGKFSSMVLLICDFSVAFTVYTMYLTMSLSESMISPAHVAAVSYTGAKSCLRFKGKSWTHLPPPGRYENLY